MLQAYAAALAALTRSELALEKTQLELAAVWESLRICSERKLKKDRPGA
jgi:hypothetical protein